MKGVRGLVYQLNCNLLLKEIERNVREITLKLCGGGSTSY